MLSDAADIYDTREREFEGTDLADLSEDFGDEGVLGVANVRKVR